VSLKKITILFSGNGTNLENIIKTLHLSKKVEVVKAISNKKDINGIKIARKYAIPIVTIESEKFINREKFDTKLLKEIEKDRPDLVVLAGFMRILTPVFTKNIKAINIHPSLLPLFRGANAIKNSFESNMKVAGVSVHDVSDELDGGKIISQECFNKENMSFEEFEKRIHEVEYELYPKAILKKLNM